MTRISLFVAIVSIGLLGAPLARAEEAPAPDPETTTTTPPMPPPTLTPPATGTMTTSSQPALCPPLTGPRADADLRPGRGLRVTGAMFITLGLATLIPGAVMTWYGLSREPNADRTQNELDGIMIGGASATAVGAASFLAGIPMVAAGVRKGTEEARRSPLSWAPGLSVGQRGAFASSTFRY